MITGYSIRKCVEIVEISIPTSFIQHINIYNSRLKEFMIGFHGVATKCLANYMYWFKWIELFKTEKDTVRFKRLFVQSNTSYSNTQIKDFKERKAIYI